MLPDSDARWHAIPVEALAWREWDGDVVIFNQRTGSTHLLGEFGSEIFRRLMAAHSGATVEALAAELTEGLNRIGVDAWTKAVAAVLSDFARLGLAQPDNS